MMDDTLVECKVKVPRKLLDLLPNIKSANPKVKTAEDHLGEAIKMYMLLHAAHNDGHSFLIRSSGKTETLRIFA